MLLQCKAALSLSLSITHAISRQVCHLLTTSELQTDDSMVNPDVTDMDCEGSVRYPEIYMYK